MASSRKLLRITKHGDIAATSLVRKENPIRDRFVTGMMTSGSIRHVGRFVFNRRWLCGLGIRTALK